MGRKEWDWKRGMVKEGKGEYGKGADGRDGKGGM